MNWAQKQRQDFIRERLNECGELGPQDIVKKFEISAAQASIDIGLFREKFPRACVYDFSKKKWVKKRS
jgi:hypothetical protein